MAYGIVHHFPGGTKEQYEAVLAVVHPNPDTLPQGQTFHAAGASAGGWTVVATTTPKRVGSGSATASCCPACSRASKVGLPRHHRRRPLTSTD